MKKIWQVYQKAPASFLKQGEGFNPLLLQILYNRKIESPEDLKWFLDEENSDFIDPFLFKDMAAAVDLIISHIKDSKKIMIYGDYDADGVNSAALLFDVLEIFKAQVSFYLPDRISEGYGLNKTALDEIKKDGFSLIITVDNGIRSKEEVAYAKSLGLEVIVTDHHAYPEEAAELPDCLIINPASEISGYPFKYLAGVGVAFKLASALISKAKLSEEHKNILIWRSLDLLAVGSITDMVPLIGENRFLVKEGLRVLNNTKRLGLLELIKVSSLNKELKASSVGFQLGPRLNAASRIKHANSALELLISKDEAEAQALAKDLNEKNIERQRISEEVLAAAESQIDPDNLSQLIVVTDFSNQSWNEGVIGLVAGKISEKYYRPVLVIVKTEETAMAEDGKVYNLYKGSGRSIEEFNMVEALEESKDFLYKYGGHPMAGGFSALGEKQTEKFIKKIKEIANNKLAKLELFPKLKIDLELSFSDIDDEFLERINKLAPFGQSNPSPKFVTYNVKIIDIVRMGFDNQHIKIKFLNHNDKDLRSFWGVSFGGGEKLSHLNISDNVDVVYSLEFNEFNGRRDIQLKIIDIKN